MPNQKLTGLEPQSVFTYFEKLCSIPHGSGNTKQISDYLVSFAKEHNLRYVQDRLNNVLIFGEGTCGYEDHEPVIIQGHMDMVCEKDADILPASSLALPLLTCICAIGMRVLVVKGQRVGMFSFFGNPRSVFCKILGFVRAGQSKCF